MALISASELASSPNSFVPIDCRFSLADPAAGERAFRESTVPGARYAHLDRDLSAPIVAGATGRHPMPTRASIAERFGRLGVSSDSSVVCFDDKSGAIAARAWWMLRHIGHADVRVLNGGFPAYLAAGGATEPGRDAPGGPALPLGEASMRVVQVDELEGLALLDARDAARYRGDIEPIDPVAGHIPGALSAPFAQQLDDSGHMKSVDALRALHGPMLAGREPHDLAAYCGSGVTACHLLLGLELAGYEGVALYPGSWSEWIVDATRAVER